GLLAGCIRVIAPGVAGSPRPGLKRVLPEQVFAPPAILRPAFGRAVAWPAGDISEKKDNPLF
ncbi:MAG TPA: hypothetical protein DCS72_01125, partial [Marinobacter adhaerens]|nr:hypothetical protein [Marinobacter adhaerens]